VTDEIPIYAEQMFWRDVISELVKARAKFPVQDGVTTCLALTEEVGELARDVLQQRFESAKYRGYAALRAEAVQCAAMAIRVALACGLDTAP
jgi:NTP pyrophosphatase (non-canonical NTP hydrolase)